MGRIRADELTDDSGTGGPDFPNSLTVTPSVNSFYEQSTVTVVNSGTQNVSGTLRFTRIGNIGFIASQGILTHDSTASAVTDVVIPANMIPTEAVWNVYVSNNNLVGNVIPLVDGKLAVQYYSPSTGAAVSRPNTGFKIDLSYMII